MIKLPFFQIGISYHVVSVVVGCLKCDFFNIFFFLILNIICNILIRKNSFLRSHV